MGESEETMRSCLVAILLAAGGCSAGPVASDRGSRDRSVDRGSLSWKDWGADRQPLVEGAVPEARLDLRVPDAAPAERCADGTPILQCSAQKPYFCNGSQLLEHKCSQCGCPGNEQCVAATDGCQPVTVALSPIADTTVSSAEPAKNYGAITTLGASSNGVMCYIDFDLSKLPVKATINKATLRLVNQVPLTFSASLLFHLVGEPWAELLLTYQSQPKVLPSPQAAGQTKAAGTYNFDVTALLQAWVDSPTVLHGLRVSATSGLANFASRESGSNGPLLTIIYR
jgi:hypothetical protein